MMTTSVDNIRCGHCGMIHGPKCPMVKAIEYYPDGSVKRVEYVEPMPLTTYAGIPVRVDQTMPPSTWTWRIGNTWGGGY